MSKGSKQVIVRVPPELLQRVQLQIAQRNAYTREAPWCVSDWVRVAMMEKLSKMERSRAKRKA